MMATVRRVLAAHEALKAADAALGLESGRRRPPLKVAKDPRDQEGGCG
jgi:hypothetical protein